MCPSALRLAQYLPCRTWLPRERQTNGDLKYLLTNKRCATVYLSPLLDHQVTVYLSLLYYILLYLTKMACRTSPQMRTRSRGPQPGSLNREGKYWQ